MSASKSLLTCLIIVVLTSGCYSQCLSKDDTPTRNASINRAGITEFGLELMRELYPYNTSKNFFFSPYSIWNALALAYFGAEGETAAQLEKVLRVKSKVEAIMDWKELQFLYSMRGKTSTSYTFNLANTAYFDKSVTIKPCLKDILKETVKKIDFSKPKQAAKTINDMVSRTTKGRISDIVTPGDVDHSRMALVNAAFFKGTWQYQFKPSATKLQLFYATPQDLYFVDMMTQKGMFRNGPVQELGAHVLELPYTGQNISMIILLPSFPAGEKGFNDMVSKITGPLLQKSIGSLWRARVHVTIPKFKMEQTLGNELIDGLISMGIRDLFDPSVANLTGFDPAGGLNVGRSIHKAFVEVNEEGTEAAAATSLIQFRVARPSTPDEFKCDHPFVFVIFDNVTKNILFMGSYKNPNDVSRKGYRKKY